VYAHLHPSCAVVNTSHGAIDFSLPADPRFQPDFSNNLTSVPAQMLTNDYSEPAPDFLSIMSATQSLVELAFIGEPLDFDLEQGLTQDDGTARGTQKLALFCLFYAFYLFYIIMSLVLLLNLLIAMMGDTYSGARENATRQFRVNFARRVLRLELQLLVFNRCGLVTLHCGKRVVEGDQETWVFTYRNYEANAEGGGRRGSKPSMFDHEVEKFAEDDERDDDGPVSSPFFFSTMEVLRCSAPVGLPRVHRVRWTTR
jgi:hypothetical protein